MRLTANTRLVDVKIIHKALLGVLPRSRQTLLNLKPTIDSRFIEKYGEGGFDAVINKHAKKIIEFIEKSGEDPRAIRSAISEVRRLSR